MSAGPKVEILAVNTLEDAFDAAPAIAGDDRFLRDRAHVHRSAE